MSNGNPEQGVAQRFFEAAFVSRRRPAGAAAILSQATQLNLCRSLDYTVRITAQRPGHNVCRAANDSFILREGGRLARLALLPLEPDVSVSVQQEIRFTRKLDAPSQFNPPIRGKE
jgi:hypothetical protein